MLKVLHFYKAYHPDSYGGIGQVIFSCAKAPRRTVSKAVTYHSDIVKQKFILLMYVTLMRHFLGDVDRIVASSPNDVATSPICSTTWPKW
ncbi:MAG: hypothetical protein GPOALKHO_000357 [Sodalis sp.]|uniref:hypothetical protein n=1 Tax=Sodalis sp. (in: enterobacteria) TaxID=1898979 RepID=UPI003872F37A|nr:MAG: hypothetical protein GPOALKHO_000357 [Sodalis sp.]